VTAAGCALLRREPSGAGGTTFTATAYCLTGTTATGMQTRPGIVAADPRVLPLGSRIRVSGAGGYSGVYTVADTGRAIRGRRIDIFMSDLRAAKRFGRRRVGVEVLGDARAR
jgi:3D (Asp-Asp-Asp) domain-containing protein